MVEEQVEPEDFSLLISSSVALNRHTRRNSSFFVPRVCSFFYYYIRKNVILFMYLFKMPLWHKLNVFKLESHHIVTVIVMKCKCITQHY